MKYIMIIALLIWQGQEVCAQTQLEKSIPVGEGQQVKMNFGFPRLITVRSWDKSEILIKGIVSINNGQADEAFRLVIDSGEKVLISSQIDGYDELPKRISIRSNSIDYYFETSDPDDPEIVAFKNSKNGAGIQYTQYGVLTDIELEVFVPSTIDLSIKAKFGMVEVKDPISSLEVNAKRGGIDVTYDANYLPNLMVETKFGEVYSNLELPFTGGNNHPTKWNRMSSTQSSRSDTQLLVSEFGNIYLRRVE